MVHQGYLEYVQRGGDVQPRWPRDGLHLHPIPVLSARQLTALVAGIPGKRSKVVLAEIGGGFGGSLAIYLEPIALALAKKTGHPVKFAMSRAEVLRATGPTSGSSIKVKIGATKDGKLTAAQVWLAYEAGGFPGSPVGAGAITAISC